MNERGLTLRKKRKDSRPVISAPTQATAPNSARPGVSQNRSGNTLVVPRDRNAPTETSDLVKRRYSTRYNQLPDFSNLDAPAVPALPSTLKRQSRGGSPKRPSTATSLHPLRIDQEALSDPHLKHERYITELLSNASEQDIQEYVSNLRRIKNRTSIDLQQNVFQNRTQFIKISKEAEQLKGEMSVLQGLMSELNSALGQGRPDTSSDMSGSLGRSSSRRTSVANLENMWNIQLQALWKQIEKSQKFLPAVPGRHIIMETGHWIELDSATWKPRRPVHIVLLNDHLLIASKKRKRVDPNSPQKGPPPTKIVAEECWPLQDIEVIDMSAKKGANGPDEKAIATALTVKSGNRSLTYRHDKRDESAKMELLMNFRKAVEDIRKANKADIEKTTTEADNMNYYASRDPASAKNTGIIESINSSKDKPNVMFEVDGKQQNFRWVEAQIDELDIEIALQKCDEAVDKIEMLRKIAKDLKSNAVAQELILVRVDRRAAQLANLISRELVESPSFIGATKRNTAYLIRLGFEDRAREVYLQARSDALSTRARQCVFEGDLHRYVFSISYIYFTMIKNTVVIFQASFAQSAMSACIKWANDHLEVFNTLLVRQLSSVEKDSKVWNDCMDVVWNHEKEMLGDAGLDFREVIGRGLSSRGRSGRRDNSQTDITTATSRERSKSKPRARTPA